MKKAIAPIFLIAVVACNNAGQSADQKKDTSASSSADSIMKAVDDSLNAAAKQHDTTIKRDSIKK
jgi:hypothetical protein